MNIRSAAAGIVAGALLAGCAATDEQEADPATVRQIESRITALATLGPQDLDTDIEILGVYLRPASVSYLSRALAGDSNAKVRAGCAMALGRSQDGRAVEPLAAAAAGDAAPEVRYSAAYCLGLFRDPRGIPVLFEALRSAEPAYRRTAIDCLYALTGEDHGYKPLATPEERRVAVGRWEEWYGRLGPNGVAPLLLPGGRVASPPTR